MFCRDLGTTEEIEYLGHKLNKKGILPLKKQIGAIENSKKYTGSMWFSGLSGHYRAQIPNFSDLVKPLTQLTKTDDVSIGGKSVNDRFSS